jgi:hypothetical protein
LVRHSAVSQSIRTYERRLSGNVFGVGMFYTLSMLLAISLSPTRTRWFFLSGIPSHAHPEFKGHTSGLVHERVFACNSLFNLCITNLQRYWFVPAAGPPPAADGS